MEEIIEIKLKKVVVEKVIAKLYGVEDSGPSGEGWKSDELIELIHVLEESISVPKDKQY